MLSKTWAYQYAPDRYIRGEFIDIDNGKTNKPILHFVHGNGFACRMYWPFLQHLSQDYALLLHDFASHGKSDTELPFAGWDEIAQRLTDTVDWLKTQMSEEQAQRPFIGGGHSLGAVISMLASAKRPDLFSRLVLLDPVLYAPVINIAAYQASNMGYERYHPLVKQTLGRGKFWPSRQAAFNYFHGRGIFKGWKDEGVYAYIDACLRVEEDGLHLITPPAHEAKVFGTTTKRLWPSIRRIHVRTDILRGEHSYPGMGVSFAIARRLNRKIHIHSTAGQHCMMQEFPEKTATRYLKLLNGSR